MERKEEAAASGVSVDAAVATALLSLVNLVLKEEQGTTLLAVSLLLLTGGYQSNT